jgi:hypothetical protein
VRAFNAVAESLALDLLQILRGRIPRVAILRVGSKTLILLGLARGSGRAQPRCSQEKRECRYYNAIESHALYLLCFLQFPCI